MDFEALGTAWAPRLLSVLAYLTGLLLLEHGYGQALQVPGRRRPSPSSTSSSMRGIAGFFELIGGALLLVGLFTRPRGLHRVRHVRGRPISSSMRRAASIRS